ncbi:MAG: silent information regulator protein Sir2, partial [Rikenellaceae bacterium]|nr:silent information regulator protein Sir2 [Rikenellaceae bacterium]
MKKLFITLVIVLLAGSVVRAQDENERVYLYPVLKPQENNRRIEPKPRVEGWATQRVEEKINRGLIALRNDRGEMYLSWRLLKGDPAGVAFNVYRSANNGKSFSKANGKPLTATTDFIDKGAGKGAYTYRICPVIGGKEGEPSEKVTPIADGLNYRSIKFQGDYVIQKVALADLNGDGNYDFVIKQPGQATDPGVWRRSPDTFKIEAYLHDGTFLWRKDLGWNIEQGVWYSPFVAWDFDGDGRAEIAVKTASQNRDYRDPQGRVVGTPPFWYAGEFPQASFTDPCPEFCSILDGMTGEVLDSVPWPPQSQRVGDYVRANRNQMGVAYLDGKTPALLLNRGTYRAMLLDAYEFHDRKLRKLWSWDGDEENPIIRSQGAHQMLSVDLDGDGRDEIVMGSVTVDDNGTALWSTGFGHPDKAIVGKVSPDR